MVKNTVHDKTSVRIKVLQLDRYTEIKSNRKKEHHKTQTFS